MEYIKDLRWKKGISVKELVKQMYDVGFQATEIGKAGELIVRMKKNKAKIYLSFTSNMVSSGLRGFFAQIIEKKIPSVICTTVGAIEEDIMKAKGEKFIKTTFNADDMENLEKGQNRIGNLIIKNASYERFENTMQKYLRQIYKKKKEWAVSEMLKEIGLKLKDKNSFLYQAAKNNIPVFCPGITDGSLGFHLYIFQQDRPDFKIDVVKDFGNILFTSSQDEKKGIIALGGGIAKHHIILATLLNGGAEYALYMTTSTQYSGSLSGATTSEAKSWGKIRQDSDAITVIGDVSYTFPLAMIYALEKLHKERILR